MRQAEIIIDVTKGELLTYACFAFAYSHHPPTDRGDRLADRQVNALDEGGVDLPACGGYTSHGHELHFFKELKTESE